MFFGKPKMDEEERKRRAAEIGALMDADRTKEAYEKTLELEKLDKDAAGYCMSLFYFLGECVGEDRKEALKRIEKYVRRVPDDSEGWLQYGYLLRLNGNETEAAKAFLKASDMGNWSGTASLAGSYKLLADGFRNEAAGTLNVKAYGENNNQAVSLYIAAMALYEKTAIEAPDALDDADWQSFGRAADMMYAMSLNGEVKKINTKDPDEQNFLNLGLSVMSGKRDTAAQQLWRLQAARIYGRMEQAGYGAMAEYFRASMCLADCGKKNQAMFVNAKWHMDRARELSAGLNADQKKSYPEDFADVREEYGKMEKKYGKIMENRLRAGEFPNLSEDYPQGQAPAVEACKSFMDFANGLRNGAPVQAAAAKEPEKKKKGLFGFFR